MNGDGRIGQVADDEVAEDGVADLVVRSESRSDTVAVGARLARLLQPHDVVILSGELGAGKTAFTSGLIAALGNEEPVTSPTFTIMRHHALGGGGQVLHLDAYRLARPDDADDIGLTELLGNGAIAIIEWGERIAAALGPDLLLVSFAHVDDADDARLITFRPMGTRWSGVDLRQVTAC